MMKNIRSYYLAAALLSGCCFVMACENDIKDVDALTQIKKTAVEEAYGIESYYSQGGRVKARLTAPYMLRYVGNDSPYVEFPRTLHVDFYNDSMQVESTLDAHYAKYHEDQHKVYLRDSVIVINKFTHDTLRTPELWWDQQQQEFYTDKPSEIHQQKGVLYARHGLRAAQDLRWREFYNASGTVEVPADNGLQ